MSTFTTMSKTKYKEAENVSTISSHAVTIQRNRKCRLGHSYIKVVSISVVLVSNS
jgi:hypothetical protein